MGDALNLVNCFIKGGAAFWKACTGAFAECVDNTPTDKVLFMCARGVHRMHWFFFTTIDLYSSQDFNICCVIAWINACFPLSWLSCPSSSPALAALFSLTHSSVQGAELELSVQDVFHVNIHRVSLLSGRAARNYDRNYVTILGVWEKKAPPSWQSRKQELI